MIGSKFKIGDVIYYNTDSGDRGIIVKHNADKFYFQVYWFKFGKVFTTPSSRFKLLIAKEKK